MRTKYDQEMKGRIIRMLYEGREEAWEESMRASFRRLIGLAGILIDTMYDWIDRAPVYARERPATIRSVFYGSFRLSLKELMRQAVSRGPECAA